MQVEIINIEDAAIRTKTEYKDRLILVQRNPTEEDPEPNYLKCPGCNILHGLKDYQIDLDGGLTLTPDFQCLVPSDGRVINITNGVGQEIQ